MRYNKNMNLEKKQTVINKLSCIVKSGHLPCRGNASYPLGEARRLANCLVHACFNLSNKELLSTFNIDDARNLYPFPTSTPNQILDDIISVLKATGLEVRKYNSGEILRNNEWRVAFYLTEITEENHGEFDYHFLLQEKNGLWTDKRGSRRIPDCRDYLPTKIYSLYSDYYLKELLVLTNPYAPEN